MEVSTWTHALNSDMPAFSRRYAIPPEHGKRLERLAIGRCPGPRGWVGGGLAALPSPAPRCCLGVGVPRCACLLPLGQALVPPVGLSLDARCTSVGASHSGFPDSGHGVWDVTPGFAGWRQPVFSPPPPSSWGSIPHSSVFVEPYMRSSVRRSSQCCTAEGAPWGCRLSMQDWFAWAPSAMSRYLH